MRRFGILVALAGLALLVAARGARADTIGLHITGTFSSVSNPGDDPVIAPGFTGLDPSNNPLPWALQLGFTQGQFDTTANLILTFDTYTFTFANTATSGTMLFDGNPLNGSVDFAGGASTPLVTVTYNDPNDTMNSGYLNLYLSGNAATADSLAGASVTGYDSASPAPFEFLNNFDTDPTYHDMSDQTDLQGYTDAGPFVGTRQTPPPLVTVPEPASLWLLATGLLGLGGLMWRRRAAPISAR